MSDRLQATVDSLQRVVLNLYTVVGQKDSLLAERDTALAATQARVYSLLDAAQQQEASHVNPWIIPVITVAGALLAGLLAQWFRVWLDNKVLKEHLIEQLDHDLERMGWLLEALQRENGKHGGWPWEILAQMDFVLLGYKSYQGQLTVLPLRLRRLAAEAFIDVAGVRQTIILASERNTRAQQGHGRPVPANEIDSINATFPALRKECRDAEVAARIEYMMQSRFKLWLMNFRGTSWFFLWLQERRKRQEEVTGDALDRVFEYRQTGKLPYGEDYEDDEVKRTSSGERVPPPAGMPSQPERRASSSDVPPPGPPR